MQLRDNFFEKMKRVIKNRDEPHRVLHRDGIIKSNKYICVNHLKKKGSKDPLKFCGALEAIRTSDFHLRRVTLYPAELQAQY